LKIAQRFSAGLITSPSAKSRRDDRMLTQRFFRPRGTCVATKTGPSAKALGYFQLNLR
jgi:hypothetical protein